MISSKPLVQLELGYDTRYDTTMTLNDSKIIKENKIMKFTDLTDYQRGLIDGYVSGLKPARNVSSKSRGTYEIKHDFESLLRLNNAPAYIPQEQAEQMLTEHGFEVKNGNTNINNTDAMYSTRRRLDISENGVIVKLDWNNRLID